MSPQPTRIILRRVPTTTRGAAAGKLAATAPVADPDVCLACGARIADVNQHADFHAGINTVMRWMQGVNELLGEAAPNPQAGEEVPGRGDSAPTAGDASGVRAQAAEDEQKASEA
ncbi:hypothetical protein [Nocardia sp. NPDC057440]|uniref:hypothetical protein n=1 Tax=Nocardia sp. NPDC057440 TaxID=3346134 RepID=UPI00366F6356